MIRIRLNGEPKALTNPVSLAKLIEYLNIHLSHVAVAVNSDVIPHSDYPRHLLRDGDKVEIIRPVGGG